MSYSPTMNVTTISDVTPPSVPSALFLTVKSASEIDVTWVAATDNVAVAGYYIYQNTNLIATVSSTPTTYANTGLAANTSYAYTVAAFDAAGNVSGQSFSVSATTQPPDTTPPTVPGNFVAKPVSVSEVDLSWFGSTDNVGVAGYNVYRNGTQIASTASTTYADTGLASDTSYTYGVAAYDAAGNVGGQASAYNVLTFSTNPAAASTAVTVTAPATTAPVTTPAAGTATATAFTFTVTLSYGSENSSVKTLQTFLIQKGYLGAAYATGFFGSLTQKAVQQFQCDENIVCSGSPMTTGWGLVGAKTRAALNASENGSAGTAATDGSAASANASAAASLQQMEAQLQALEAQLKALQGGQ